MTTIRSFLALGLALLLWSGTARAADVPAVPGAGGVKALPGTVQKDATDAVRQDVGKAVGMPAEKAPAVAPKDTDDDDSGDVDDEDVED